jgi:hypothetical protein
MLSQLAETHWSARGFCEACSKTVFVIVPIPENRIVEVLNCMECDNPMVWSSSKTSNAAMDAWAKLTKSVILATEKP